MFDHDLGERSKDVMRIVFAALSLFFTFSIFSYDPGDVAWLTTEVNTPIANYTGLVGAYLVFAWRFLFGHAVWVLPLLLGFWAFNIVQLETLADLFKEAFGSIVVLCCLSALIIVGFEDAPSAIQQGGIIGFQITSTLEQFFNSLGSFFILSTVLILAISLATEVDMLSFLSMCLVRLYEQIVGLKDRFADLRLPAMPKASAPKPKKAKPRVVKHSRAQLAELDIEDAEIVDDDYEPEPARALVKKIAQKSGIKVVKALPKVSSPKKSKKLTKRDAVLPPINLLEQAEVQTHHQEEDVQAVSELIRSTLEHFGIEVDVVQVNQGPVITVYELQPAPGIKVNKIVNLANDIKLAIKAPSVRMIAPVPGKSVVGIEVPNKYPEKVFFRDLVESEDFQDSPSPLTMALGKDVSGKPLISALDTMPHLLIAGATGAGKTVCVNSLIVSMLYKSKPEDVRFIMIDPKMVEMTFYNGIPHLLTPVITNPKKAVDALEWAVREMEERYEIFAEVGVRNIAGYNKRMANTAKEPLQKKQSDSDSEEEPEYPQKMSYIVIVVDELADLMMTSGQEVETSITRLAQLSRAVGIHIILATQRPSVNVITGLIKANFPCRISFKVSSSIDSRTILDSKGAETLIGKGDLLFVPPGLSALIRSQGCYLSDEEIRGVVDFLKEQGEPEYHQGIFAGVKKSSSSGGGDEDELYDEAVRVVLETGQASASMLQRRMRIGYNRASRLIDAMEEKGIVGAYRGSKPREVLFSGEDDI